MKLRDPALAPGARHLAVPVRSPGAEHVAVLLGVCNGEAHLAAQLASLARQTHGDWSLLIGDDGSRDESAAVIHRFAAAHPERSVRLVPGPRKGFQRNFLALLDKVPAHAAYVAFCDQDDVWLDGKLARAVSMLRAAAPGRPVLYGARTLVTDDRLVPNGMSPLFGRAPSFRNALVQSIAGGNTMVLNRAALDLLKQAGSGAVEVVSHDWWAYQVVAGAGGRVIYDRRPSLLYRQHGTNLVGANSGPGARFRRLAALLRGDFRRYSDVNLCALWGVRHLLTEENRRVLGEVRAARAARLPVRLRLIRKSGIYRQTAAGNVALWCAAVLGRL